MFILDYPASSKLLNFHMNMLHRSMFIWLILIALFAMPVSAANKPHIAVLYPESSSRVSQLYATIIKSMHLHDNIIIQSKRLSADESVDDIQQWLTVRNIKAVILLGNKGLQFSLGLSLDIPVITGAHLKVLPDHSSISLTADPEQLFSKLKSLKSDIQQVHVIYNETNTGWLIKKAKLAARKKHIKLNAIQTDSVQASGQSLKQLMQQIETEKDAIWLPYDPIVPIKPLLPDLLKKSWEKNLIIFSGNPYHVQQGTLFALFPDYSKLGQQLIDLALNKLDTDSSVRIEPSIYLNSAINIRTASHLDIQISSMQKENYKMVFPNK